MIYYFNMSGFLIQAFSPRRGHGRKDGIEIRKKSAKLDIRWHAGGKKYNNNKKTPPQPAENPEHSEIWI